MSVFSLMALEHLHVLILWLVEDQFLTMLGLRALGAEATSILMTGVVFVILMTAQSPNSVMWLVIGVTVWYCSLQRLSTLEQLIERQQEWRAAYGYHLETAIEANRTDTERFHAAEESNVWWTTANR